jgi:hypothetical protein
MKNPTKHMSYDGMLMETVSDGEPKEGKHRVTDTECETDQE